MQEAYRKLTRCRICGSKDLTKYLDLGTMPLANSLLDEKDIDAKENMFPLEVLYCSNCSLSQLSIVVDPRILFSNYVYRSSISKTFQDHCKNMAEAVSEIFRGKNNLVVDIASNDGCLLEQFKDCGFKVLGIEPAENLARIANSTGIETIGLFWNVDAAKKVLKKYGRAKVITATNVLAHVDEVNDFLKGVHMLLDDDGLFIVEAPYLYDLLAKNEFDTIYHEHLSYFLVKPLIMLYEKNGLAINRIEKFPIHGGSLRIYASKNKSNAHESVNEFLSLEKSANLYGIDTYKSFDKKAKKVREDLIKLLTELKRQNKKVAAYGASAKGNTLLNYCNATKDMIKFIIEDTPEKQNKLAPGSRIPIKDASYLDRENPDFIVLLAWNFAKEIMQKTEKYKQRGGRYIIPIPEVKIV